jgi:hypothetical protein
MKSKNPQPAFIEFANLPKIPDGFSVLGVPDWLSKDVSLDVVRSGHSNLRKLLDRIIQDKQINMSKELKYFIHGALPYKHEYIVENGKLILRSIFDPDNVLLDSLAEPTWFHVMKIELLNYLTDQKEDKRRLKKCPICNKYYIAENVRRFTRCYSIECEKVYQRNKKRRQRKEDPVRYF